MPSYIINSFSGGQSDHSDIGVKGAYKYARNHDPRKIVDSLSCNQAVTDDLAAGTLASLAKFCVVADDGNCYIFEDNKIYKRTSAGSYSLVYTDSDAGIRGAAQGYNHTSDTFVFWTTATKLKRKRILNGSSAIGTDWSDVNATINSETYPKTDLTSAIWHTMRFMFGGLYGGNDDKLFLVSSEDDTYTNEAVRLAPGNSVKTIADVRSYIYAGSIDKGGEVGADISNWDGIADNYLQRFQMPAAEVNAIINSEYPIVQVGDDGQIYYIGEDNSYVPITNILDGGEVNPDGVAVDGGLALLGVFGNGDGKTGIWSYGRKRKNDMPVLNLEYQFDCDEIGFVKKVGDTILFSYKDGSNYGVKKIDTSNKAAAVYESLELEAPNPEVRKANWRKARVSMAPLPSGCSIELYRRLDKVEDNSVNSAADSSGWIKSNVEGGNDSFGAENETEVYFLLGDSAKIIETKLVLTPSGNTAPEVYEIELEFD